MSTALSKCVATLANWCKADVTKEYIGKAIEKKYAVIDVNVPKHITTDLVRGF